MTEDAPKRDGGNPLLDLSRPLDGQTSLLEWFYAQSQAGRWGVPRERFAAALERSAKKALTRVAVTPQQLQDYLGALHLEDLALATACAALGQWLQQQIETGDARLAYTIRLWSPLVAVTSAKK